ncbi:agmatine deiminase family protein [bacterium]|nr:agmatine deiminase family protein [bacterium]
MPAEWEPQEAMWLAWPHRESSWPGLLPVIPNIYAQIVKALMPHQKVRVLVRDEELRGQAEETLRHFSAYNENVELIVIPTDDSWMRDCGPIFVRRPAADGGFELAAIDWEFNTWGDKYPPYGLDNQVPTKIAEMYGFPMWSPGIVMEGGSIDVNGRGTLMTSEACLLNPNRNPHLTREQIEEYLKAYLGVRHILWLGDGIVGDDTDGHIDDLTRFVDPTTVVTVIEENPADENYDILQENLRRLRGMRDQDGRPLLVETLPMPSPVIYEDTRLPASYANFLIANDVVLVPTYECANDVRALQTMKRLFPHREIVGIPCSELVWGLGALHCISQQQPRAKVASDK